MQGTSPEVRWIAAETRVDASSRCPLGYVVTGTSVVDKGSGKLVWESIRVMPSFGNPRARQGEEMIQERKEERGIGQAEAAPAPATAPATPTGVFVVGGLMVVAIVGYAAYEYKLKDWLEEDEKGDAKAKDGE